MVLGVLFSLIVIALKDMLICPNVISSQKNYGFLELPIMIKIEDPKNENKFKYIIKNSYMLTIYGYSAPSSDGEAEKLLKKAWGDLVKRQLEEVSVLT